MNLVPAPSGHLVLPKRAARAAAVFVVGIVLAACGTMHPGQAAVVDNHTISMAKVGQRADAYCAVSLVSAQQQGIKALSNAEIRRQAVSDLVTMTVATDVAEDEGVTADPKLYSLSDEQSAQIRRTFAKADPDQVVEAILMAQKTYALTIALGAKETGKQYDEKNADELRAAGEQVIAKAMKKADIQIDDRFGLDDTTAQISDTGSQSVSQENLAQTPADKLPSSQRCS